MKTILLLKKLERYPLFTENDLAKILPAAAAYLRTVLFRLHKNGYIYRIERGKYTVHEDPLVYASHLTSPSYFSLWTALRFHDLTTQQPANIFLITAVPKKSITLRNTTIFFRKSKYLFGYSKQRYADVDIFMAEPEKAVIDSLLFKLPLEYILDALEEKLDYPKLAGYALKTNNKSLIKRLGYLLEQKTGKNYNLTALDNNYVPLDYHGKKKGFKNKKWKLIINAALEPATR